MGLTVTRRVGESVVLEVAEGTTPQELREALQGGISVRLVASQNTRARLDFNVPQLLCIAREELVEADLD